MNIHFVLPTYLSFVTIIQQPPSKPSGPDDRLQKSKLGAEDTPTTEYYVNEAIMKMNQSVVSFKLPY